MGRAWVAATAILFLTLAIATVPSEAGPTGNLLANAGFEQCSGCALDALRTPDQWSVLASTANARGGWTAQQHLDGAYAYYVTDSSEVDSFAIRSDRVSVRPGETIEGALHLRRGPSVPVYGSVVLYLEFYAADATSLLERVWAVQRVESWWAQVTATRIAPAGAAWATIRFESDGPTTGDLYLDAGFIVVVTRPLPKAMIASPAAGATVSGSVNVSGTVDPNGATVTMVQVTIDHWGPQWVNYDSRTRAWWYNWNTFTWKNGPHVILVRAWAGSGEDDVGPTAWVSVTLANPLPSATINAATGSIKGIYTVTGTANANGGALVLYVRYQITTPNAQPSPDWWRYGVQGTTSWSFGWDTRVHADGTWWVWIQPQAWVYAGSAVHQAFTVSNPGAGASITSAPSSARGVVTISGVADANGGEPVQRVFAGVLSPLQNAVTLWYTANGTTDWTYSWDTRSWSDGPYTLSAMAWNGYKYGPAQTYAANLVVSNPAPTMTVTLAPGPGLLEGIIHFEGTVDDHEGEPVSGVYAVVDGLRDSANAYVIGTDGWSLDYDTTALTPGLHEFSFTVTNGYKSQWGVGRMKAYVNAYPEFSIGKQDLRGNYYTGRITLTATVTNTGGQSPGFYVLFDTESTALEGYRWSCFTPVESMPAGSPLAPVKITVTCDVPASTWNYLPTRDVRVTVDAYRQIPELDEGNNAAQRTMVLGPNGNGLLWPYQDRYL